MRPAFSSTKQAAAFALLLFGLLVLPVVMGKNLLPPRAEAYASQSWGTAAWPWIQQQIFEETNNIDMVFLGSSHLIQGIDAPLLQAELGKKLGRPAVVRTLSWGGAGFDGLYLVAQDLLEHRQVRQMVFYDEHVDGSDKKHGGAIPYLFRFSDHASSLRGLPVAEKGVYYFAALMGMPINLLGLIRPAIPAEPYADRPGYIPPKDKTFSSAPERLGSISALAGYNANLLIPENAPFVPFTPAVTNELAAHVYTVAQPDTNFEFSATPLPVWQAHFAREFGRLAARHGCQLVLLDLPTLETVRNTGIHERAFWSQLIATNLPLVGVPAQQMFGSLTDAEILKLYSDKAHLNKNGQDYFTPLIAPVLINLYEAAFAH